MTPQDFVHKWKQANLSERSAYQQHFLDLCELLHHDKPDDEWVGHLDWAVQRS